MQMKSGEAGKITCPAEHDTGRGMKTGAYNNEDTDKDDLERTAGNADVTYELDVVECGGADFQPLAAKEVKDGQCMNIVSAWVKQNDQNLALMPGKDSTEFNLSVWNKTDNHQKWQWNSSDKSLHTWIDVSTYEPSIKFSNSYCSNQGAIGANIRADN